MVDSAKITIRAGNGGDGVVHFYRGRFVPKGGPDGGDGGKGGNVYIETDSNLATLDHFAYKQRFEAKNGRPGGGSRSSGKAGEDLHIKVPLGTVVKLTKPQNTEYSTQSEYGRPSSNLEEGKREKYQVIDFDVEGMVEMIGLGGKGGRGNWHFRSPTNTTPIEAEVGVPGEEWQVEMDLKLLADVGLVGLPNVGKSTLLSILSNARPKVADYEFTTLEPNLGVLRLAQDKSIVLADIPGLIEGASEGRGLGIRFLRHVERTKLIVHLLALKNGEENLSVDEAVEKLVTNHRTIRKELTAYAKELGKKKEIVVLNKIDLLPAENVDGIVAGLAQKKIKVIKLSSGTLAGLPELKKKVSAALSSLEL